MKKSTFEEFVKQEVYVPMFSYHRVDTNKCRAHVPDGGRSVGSHQCTRNVVETLEGYGFCLLHAQELKTKFGIVDQDKIEYTYAARYVGDASSITKLGCSQITDKTIYVVGVEDILGDAYFSIGRQSIVSGYNKSYKFFSSEESAWMYLLERAGESYQYHKQEQEKTIKTIETLNKAISQEIWNRH